MMKKKVSADGIRPNLTSRYEKNMQNRYSFLSKSKLQGSHAAEHPTRREKPDVGFHNRDAQGCTRLPGAHTRNIHQNNESQSSSSSRV